MYVFLSVTASIFRHGVGTVAVDYVLQHRSNFSCRLLERFYDI